MVVVVVVVVLLGLIYWKLILPEKRVYEFLRAQKIPGEPFVPLIGQLRELSRYRNADKMMEFYDDQVKKHGHVYLSSFGPVARLVINEPELLADVLHRNNASNYVKPPLTNAIFFPIIGEHNLLVSDGVEHERARRMLNPAFHHLNLKSMISIIVDRTRVSIDSILRDEKTSSCDLQIVFNALTLSIIVSSAFGTDLESDGQAKDVMCRVFAEVLDAVIYRSLRMINQIPFLSRLPFCRRDVVDRGATIVGEFVERIILDRRQGRSMSMSSGGGDLLDLLLSAVDDEGKTFTNEEIKEQALTFVLAGSETTGNLMVWIFYVLMTHDDVRRACQDELERILPDQREPTHELLNELHICEAVINETLRLYPPAPFFARHAIREHSIGTDRPIVIPKGISVLVNSYILHRREDLWPRPLEFDYRRWLRDPKTGLKPKLVHPFAYLPFAAGPRNCIGQNFALLEAKIMLSMFLQRCRLTLLPGQKIVPDVKITMRTKYGLWANLSARSGWEKCHRAPWNVFFLFLLLILFFFSFQELIFDQERGRNPLGAQRPIRIVSH